MFSSSMSVYGVPGRARKCFYIGVPFAWSDRDKMKWCGDESDYERERERVLELSLIHI